MTGPARASPSAAGDVAMGVQLKRVYDPPSAGDGVRILVDRLWPRGLSRAKAAIQRWEKEIAPSDELRRWFGHDPARWPEFRRRYAAELRAQAALLADLRALAAAGPITLVYAAGDTVHNNAVVLAELLQAAQEKPGHGMTGSN